MISDDAIDNTRYAELLFSRSAAKDLAIEIVGICKMDMSKRRLFGVIAVPIGIDKYETVNHLDISRDIGSLPWLILTVIGVVMVVSSFFQKLSE